MGPCSKVSGGDDMKEERSTQEINGAKLPVHIRPDGDVDNGVVNVRKSAKDEVVWYSEGDEFEVHFPTTPFVDDTFLVPAGGSRSSGPALPSASIGHYEYFITSVALAKSADPGVDIKP